MFDEDLRPAIHDIYIFQEVSEMKKACEVVSSGKEDWLVYQQISGLMQGCSISIANALEILPSSTTLSKWISDEFR